MLQKVFFKYDIMWYRTENCSEVAGSRTRQKRKI